MSVNPLVYVEPAYFIMYFINIYKKLISLYIIYSYM